MINDLISAFSHERNAWCVYRKESNITMSFVWRCHTKDASEKLAKDVNDGAMICRGSRNLGTACGKCVKCELTI